jgi:hypothetical protein
MRKVISTSLNDLSVCSMIFSVVIDGWLRKKGVERNDALNLPKCRDGLALVNAV